MKQIVLAIGLMALAPAAQAATLDFSGDICGDANDSACFNSTAIGQGYGDIAGEVDFQWDADRSTAALDNILHWSGNYEDLSNVGYALSRGAGMKIVMAAASGFDVLLNSFSIARYANLTVTTSIKVTDLANSSVLLDTGNFSTTLDDSIDYTLNARSSSGFEILFGPDAWNVGISNISYSTAATPTGPTPGVVPLPAAGWLMLAGLGGLAAMRRTRNQA